MTFNHTHGDPTTKKKKAGAQQQDKQEKGRKMDPKLKRIYTEKGRKWNPKLAVRP